MFKETEVSGCHFMGGFSLNADGIVAPDGCELYLAPGSLMRGLYISPIVSNQPDDTFDIGDVVGLIVGGPDMVVISVCECGTVEVAWADSDGDVCVDVFPEEALVHVDE